MKPMSDFEEFAKASEYGFEAAKSLCKLKNHNTFLCAIGACIETYAHFHGLDDMELIDEFHEYMHERAEKDNDRER